MKQAFAALAITALIFVPPAAGGEIEIERMTSPEVAAAIQAGATAIILPTGGTEQNGPHMVLGKHNVIVAETARRIAGKLGQTLVAPVLAYAPEGDIAKREGHMAYAGTISVSPAVFTAVLEEAAKSFRAHGFKTIVFLGDSGPNQEPQRALAVNLTAAWAGEGVRVLSPAAYYGANGGLDWLKSQGETEAQIGTHAAIRDTSELMALDPAGIRPGKMAAGKDGVIGDPTRASAERGEKLLGLKVEAAVRDIEAALKAPLPAGSGTTPDASGGGTTEGFFARLWRWLFG
ncbi:MAG: creatininase family protein [Hyphomicrobium sp.]